MENTNQLFSKIITVQNSLKAPKDKYNSFGKYAYRSAESILEAVKPLLLEQGLMLTLSDEIECIGGRVYVRANATVVDKATGEWHKVSAFAREDETLKGMAESQITGSSSSYARKYALNGLFLIDDNKDADTVEYHSQIGGGQLQPQTPQIEIDAYKREISEIYDADMLKEWWKNANPDIPADIKMEIYDCCKARLNELIKKEK